MPVRLTETTPLSEAGTSTPGPSGRMVVQAISAGLGTSGYYSPQVLEQAAADRLISRGTPLHLDHASESERRDRPERSVQTIAGVFTADATYDPARQALVGDVQVFTPFRERLTEMAPYLGLSISGSATDIVEGEHEGRRVPVVEGLAAIDSVDFVVRAGRGGQVLSVAESAQPAAALIDHLQAAYGPALVEAGLTLTPGPTTPNVPATRPDSITTTTEVSKEDPMGNIQIDEAEHQRLVEQAGRVDALTAERDTERARANTAEQRLAETTATAVARPRTPRQVLEERDADLRVQVATLRARERARDIIAEELAEAWLAPTTIARLSGELLESLPLVNDQLDEPGLRTRCVERRDQHELEAAEALTAAGVGTPRGLGAIRTPDGDSADRYTDSIKESFLALGLSESAADIAVKGR